MFVRLFRDEVPVYHSREALSRGRPHSHNLAGSLLACAV
jgi:hypothetical protein